jgi:hypothetical protein
MCVWCVCGQQGVLEELDYSDNERYAGNGLMQRRLIVLLILFLAKNR